MPLAELTPLACLLRGEIARAGSLPFARFMELALQHPEHGYYRRGRDPFGVAGDFYTATQVQPVFGRLVASAVRPLLEACGPDAVAVDLGAGRAEMAAAFAGWPYVPVDLGRGDLPESFDGVVFANEFFDALPVHAAVRRGGQWRERRVAWKDSRFAWVEGDMVDLETQRYLDAYRPGAPDGTFAEAGLAALDWVRRIAGRMRNGWLLAVDYGYTAAEAMRFPHGTLMAYRRHVAHDDVLCCPGEQDVTAHVNLSALSDAAMRAGLSVVRQESLRDWLLRAGESDGFAAALQAGSPREELRLRLQLKTLLFGMGETFRVVLARKAG